MPRSRVWATRCKFLGLIAAGAAKAATEQPHDEPFVMAGARARKDCIPIRPVERPRRRVSPVRGIGIAASCTVTATVILCTFAQPGNGMRILAFQKLLAVAHQTAFFRTTAISSRMRSTTISLAQSLPHV